MASHKALGRGLDALFSTTTRSPRPEGGVSSVEKISSMSPDQTLFEIEVEKIKPNRHQPRTEFNNESLEELAESIRIHGIAQPLVVTESLTSEGFELVMGERRLRAAKMVGLAKVPCLVKRISNRERFELALIENIQREDLNGMEKALAMDGLMKEFNLTQEEVARAVGQSRSSVANILRFLRLHDDVQQALRENNISEGHAKWLAGIADPVEQLRLLAKILMEGFSVRDLEAFLESEKRIDKRTAEKPKKAAPSEKKEYEEEFQRLLGRRVEIQTKGKKGWIRFAFYSPMDLDVLCKRLGLIKEEDASPPA